MTGSEPKVDGENSELAQLQRALASVYKVERLLTRRGAVVLYQAAENATSRAVTLRIFPPGLGLGPASAAFKEAARQSIALNDPNIVPVYRVGLRAGVPFFVAMKFVEGRTLQEIIEAQGALPVPVILAVVRAAAAALVFAHGRGTLHGALTPANILFDRDGHVVVSEFGLARAINEALPPASAAARPATPEEAAGGPAGPAGDQYALGSATLAMLTGSLLDDTDPLGSLTNIRSARVALPDALVRIVQTQLAQDPAGRFPTTADMVAAIEAIPFSDADGREASVTLGRLARGEPVPKLRALAPPRTVEVRAVGAAPAPKAASAPPPPPPPPAPAPRAAAAASSAPTVKAPAIQAPRPAPPPPVVQAPPPPPPAAVAPPPAPRVEAMPVMPAEEPVTAPPPMEAAPAAEAPYVPELEPAEATGEAAPTPPAAPAIRRVRATADTPVAPSAAAEPEPKGRSRLVWVLAALLVVAALGGGAYWFLVLRQPAAAPVAQAPAPVQAPVPAAPVTSAPAVANADSARRADSARADSARKLGKTGVLMLQATPKTAFIFLDEKPVGRRGVLDSAVAAGQRHLEVDASGYEGFDTVIVVPEGDTLDLGEIPLSQSGGGAAAAATQSGKLQLSVVPRAADIFVDGERVGSGSLTDFEVGPGQRQVRIVAPGYVTLDTTVTVEAGATVQLGQIFLKPNPNGP